MTISFPRKTSMGVSIEEATIPAAFR
jgi:hypothetical protein